MTNQTGQFIARQYSIKPTEENSLFELYIEGDRKGKPSNRLTLKQSGLKVISAAIHSENKNKVFDYDIARINHLPTVGEVRLHTKNLMYPGSYKIQLVFRGKDIDDIEKYLKSDRSEPETLYWPSLGSNHDTEIKII